MIIRIFEEVQYSFCVIQFILYRLSIFNFIFEDNILIIINIWTLDLTDYDLIEIHSFFY